MSEQKEKIEELSRKKKEKHVRELLAGIGLVVIGAAAVLGLNQFSVLDSSNTEKQIEYDKEITIASGIRPYRTSINQTSMVKFRNTRTSPVNITFETNSIDRQISIGANQSGYFNASRYEGLPYRNYFNLDSGDTGEMLVN
jgi:hypothetical protein